MERALDRRSEREYPAGPRPLEVHDLLASKAIAGREKDVDFLNEAAKHGLGQKDEILSRLALVNASPPIVERAQALIQRVFS